MKFRMVDRILDWEPHRMIRGIKAVSFEEYELRQRLGYPPALPESLVMESLFQLANWLVILSTNFEQMGIAIKLDEAKFFGPVLPGRRLYMEAFVRGWHEDSAILEGTVSDDEKIVATGTRCLTALLPLAEYYVPDDLRVLFSEIYRPEPCEQPGESPWRD
jgi:3-hydroxyacyl-[acyl-carrier-protein] dehydratase